MVSGWNWFISIILNTRSSLLNIKNLCQIANSALSKGKPTMPPIFNSWEVLSSVSYIVKLFAKNLFKKFHHTYSVISFSVFYSATSINLHNISVTSTLIKKFITNTDLSKASGPDCIPVVVSKNYEPELSFIPAELFNMCQKEFYFTDC